MYTGLDFILAIFFMSLGSFLGFLIFSGSINRLIDSIITHVLLGSLIWFFWDKDQGSV
jgi:hypothetical protein